MGRKVAAVVFASALVAVVLSAGARSVAQESGSQPARRLRTSDPPAIFDDTQSAPDQDVQFVRKDLRSQKKQMVAANMDLTDTEAERYIRRRAAVEEDVMQLRLKYVPEFRKVLSGRQTALFFQIEWRLDLMINLQLAQAPLIDP